MAPSPREGESPHGPQSFWLELLVVAGGRTAKGAGLRGRRDQEFTEGGMVGRMCLNLRLDIPHNSIGGK